MLEPIHWIIALPVGLALGAIFYGGLWWTVRKLHASKSPAMLFLGSLLVRMAILLLGIYAVGMGHWERMVVAVVGVMLARFIVLRVTKEKEGDVQPSTPDPDAS